MFKFNEANDTATIIIQDYRACQSPPALPSMSSATIPFLPALGLLWKLSFHDCFSSLDSMAYHLFWLGTGVQGEKINIKKKKTLWSREVCLLFQLFSCYCFSTTICLSINPNWENTNTRSIRNASFFPVIWAL